MRYNTYTLDNGLRIIHLPSDGKVMYCGYQIAAGTRDEQPGEEGLAHFCEHVTFKGTERRKAWHILNCLESVGGELNAFTNKDSTTYYSAVLKEHTPRAVDLLSDIVFHSVYPQQEIDKEVEVICDEIESYNDTPSELIFDEMDNILFAGHPMGHNILGTADTVRGFKTEDARRFTRKFYRPDNTIFFAHGDIDFKKLVKLEEKSLPQICGPHPETNVQENPVAAVSYAEPKNISSVGDKNIPSAGETIVKQLDTHQAHVMIATRAYSFYDKRKTALSLLNNILGGPGMNARLNIALREKKGLVYNVESNMATYRDTGIWSIYFGCDKHDVKKCLRLVRRELDKLADRPMSEAKLRAAKKQIKGQIGVGSDNREAFALDFGKCFLFYGKGKNLDNLYRQIDEVTADDILAVAREIFDKDKLLTLIFE